MFIGREAELSFLEGRYRSGRPELIVLYGRRRIGKTELLRQFAKGKEAVFYACTECTDAEQLGRFSKRLLSAGMPAARFLRRFEDWEQAFRSIIDLPSGRKLLIIDEFPYMAAGNPSIPSILQNLWDELLQKENVMLILCGSSLSFIERELLAEKNPLYGRATGIYRLGPLSFAESRQFFQDCSFEDQLIYYAILGGIPHYLRQFSPRLTVAENIKTNILAPGSVLYSETEFMLHQELRETSIYNVIIEAIAQGATTLNVIREKTGLEGTKVSAYLKNLMELGLVRREFSVLASTRERATRGKGLYRLSDDFFRFWYAFCYANASELAAGDGESLYRYEIEPHLPEFAAPVFEKISLEALRRLNGQGKLPFRFLRAGRWWDKVTHVEDGKKRTVAEEIDIVATDATGQNYLLCECKYRRGGAGVGVLKSLKEKFPTNKGNLHYAIFSFFGANEELKKLSAEGELLLFGAKELEGILI